MKAGNREINIFNMSLLDILCGAMGAFCFMMIALLPYWSPSGPASAETLKNQKELEQKVEELRKRLEQAGPGAQAALELLKQLQAQVQKLQGQLNRALGRVGELEAENKRLLMRNPIVVTMTWSGREHDMDLHIFGSNVKSTKGSAPAAPDPNKKQGPFFSGDATTEVLSGPGTEVWVVRDTATGGKYEIHYKFMDAGSNSSPDRVTGQYVHNGRVTNLPAVTIAQAKTSVHVGTLNVGSDYTVKFEPSDLTREVWQRMLENDRKREQEKKGSAPPQ